MPSARLRLSDRVRRSRLPRPVAAADRLEQARALDRPAYRISRRIRRLLPPGPVKDALHGVFLGHPAHPALTDVPLGCWISVALLDMTPNNDRASRLLVAAGLAGTVPTVLTGWADWASLHRGQQRLGLVHAAAGAGASLLYSASLGARLAGHRGTGRALGYLGLGVVATGAYLGGHLAFRRAAGANHAESITHLVPLGWHDLCTLTDLPDGVAVRRRLGYINVVVLRQSTRVYALADSCPHLGGPLHQGRISGDDGLPQVTCPWHGSEFRLTDGSVVHGPATAPAPHFETRMRRGIVQVRAR
ncbi:MAG: Rieske 2Fe-2S domain-containing protein [Streptosporangiales bacterium]|nr:Rieske 2Fe-2S domain-containing protein [Streptosporangiales bacterium]